MNRRTIKQSEENPVNEDVLAEAIMNISAGMARLNASKINRKGILVLLSHSCKIPQTYIARVLDAIEDLKKDYCK